MPHFTIGGVIGAGCSVLIRDFLRLLAIGLAVAVPVGLVLAVAILEGPFEAGGAVIRVAPEPGVDIGAILYWLAVALLFLAGYAAALTALTHGALQALGGEPVGIGVSLRVAIRTLPKAFGAILVYCLVAGILLVAVVWCIVALSTELSVAWRLPDFIDYGKLARNGGIGLVGLVLLLLFMIASWVFVPALAVEGAGPIRCFRRSFALTKGRRWKVLAIVVLLAVVSVGSSLLTGQIQQAGAVDLGAWLDYALTGLQTALGVTISAAGYQRLRAEKEGGADLAQVFD